MRYWFLLAGSALIINICFLSDLIKKLSSVHELINDDMRTIVNYRDFEYLISKPKCPFTYDRSSRSYLPYFLILVHSAAGNYQRRSVIRDTWGHSDSTSKTVFYY